jgi:hypothetical protein
MPFKRESKKEADNLFYRGPFAVSRTIRQGGAKRPLPKILSSFFPAPFTLGYNGKPVTPISRGLRLK